MFVQLWKDLRERGVLGVNQRNGDFTSIYNPRKLYPLVDDKLKTKKLAREAGIAVPDLYAVVEEPHQVHELQDILSAHEDFAVKPAQGSGGEGILVIVGRSKHLFRNISGRMVSEESLKHHMLNILSGMYSLGGQPDKAIIEYRVKFDLIFDPISFRGVPDIRIITFLGVPVMAMIRLPTMASDGKANLHQGAIGSGIDMKAGLTTTAVWHNTIVSEHPDTGATVSGIQIPGWEKLLVLAARCYELTGLGYQGVDIVLDRDLGPLILELNARPGLNIQLANRKGLLPRLRLVEQAGAAKMSVEERVQFAREHF